MNSKHDFYLGITSISRHLGSTLSFDLIGNMDDLRVAYSYVKESSEISIIGIAESVHGGILVSGNVRTRWDGECRRCLEAASGEIIVSLRELFEREGKIAEESDVGDTYHFSGEVIDLREMVKDQVLLELPLAPLCKADCKGLCPSCGTDLNFELCACSNDLRDPRWGALDVLVDKDR